MSSSSVSLFALFLAWLSIFGYKSSFCVSGASDDGVTGNYLWDLSADPEETNNLYDDPDYADIRDSLLSQLEAAWYDENNTVSCDGDRIGNEDEIIAEVYASCGGVCSYIDEDTVVTTEQIYYPENPPNIVFILADDWGYNDVGLQSTYLDWATPNIDAFIKDGISMSNYFTHYFCAPSRGALMTGRTADKLGLLLHKDGCELPLTEVTIANEMKSAGYMTYMVGKWHLGYSSTSRAPLERGFDYFYGYYSGFIDYYTKLSPDDYLDLQNNGVLETDSESISDDYHSAYLFQSKVQSVIETHASTYPTTPMFLYYALQLIHFPFFAPSTYTDRCTASSKTSDYVKYCGLTLMLDEVIANVTCVLESTGLMDNTFVVLASDNGGNDAIRGNSVPYRGHKYDFTRGGVSANAFIFSKLLAQDIRGTSYRGLMHVSDWLPTLMYVATEGAWTGSYSGATLDGVNQWEAIMHNLDSPRSVIVHYAYYQDGSTGSIQVGQYKLDYGIELPDVDYPETLTDSGKTEASTVCSSPSYSLTVSEIVLTILPADGSDAASLLTLSLSLFVAVFIIASALRLVRVFDQKRWQYQLVDEKENVDITNEEVESF